ncbi:Molybdopterin binding protein [Phycomyces nitens]|nr:Molybdopterin binding protein [Phycomyces nitens]
MTITAACCLIGDEILSGKTRDLNAHCLANFLFDLGISLKRIDVVSDDEEAIGESVRRLAKDHALVFTSGGIGPTHDDITYAAVAKAFDLSLEMDNETKQRLAEMAAQRQRELTDAHLRMALFPHPAILVREDPSLLIPVVVVVGQVYILPGIPQLFQRLLYSLKPYFSRLIISQGHTLEGFVRREVVTYQPETQLAAYLTGIQAEYPKDQLLIGSYPELNGKVVISIVGKDKAEVDRVGDRLENELKEIKSHL